jgi:hypothetical protein
LLTIPHQTTLDQFFDQEQFEAYRQLGVHVAEALFLPALMSNTTPRSVTGMVPPAREKPARADQGLTPCPIRFPKPNRPR